MNDLLPGKYEYWIADTENAESHTFIVKEQSEQESNTHVVYGDMGLENARCFDAVSRFIEK